MNKDRKISRLGFFWNVSMCWYGWRAVLASTVHKNAMHVLNQMAKITWSSHYLFFYLFLLPISDSGYFLFELRQSVSVVSFFSGFSDVSLWPHVAIIYITIFLMFCRTKKRLCVRCCVLIWMRFASVASIIFYHYNPF